MLIYLYQTAWSLATTTDYERQFTEKRHLQDQSSKPKHSRPLLTNGGNRIIKLMLMKKKM